MSPYYTEEERREAARIAEHFLSKGEVNKTRLMLLLMHEWRRASVARWLSVREQLRTYADDIDDEHPEAADVLRGIADPMAAWAVTSDCSVCGGPWPREKAGTEG